MRPDRQLIVLWLGLMGFLGQFATAGELFVGSATISITPEEPVLLDGQRSTRIGRTIESPCLASAIVVETRNGEAVEHVTAFVSCDLVAIRGGEDLYALVRNEIRGKVPDELLPRLILNATHTHTGPVIENDGRYDLPEEGVMVPTYYREFLVKRIGQILVEAWTKRAPAQVAWGLGHAVVAYNRRPVFADGKAKMYGKVNTPDFRQIEGAEDHGVEILYFWDHHDQLIGTAINVACPAQEVEGRSAVNADFWHPIREQLRERHGDQLVVLGWTGAGGDQSPHVIYRKPAEERMQKLRGISRLDELARRIVSTWEDVYQAVQSDKHKDVVLEERVETVSLPYRKISTEEYEFAKAEIAKLEKATDRNANWNRKWHSRVVERYDEQQNGLPNYEMQLRTVRLGDIAIVTNDFELFTDFGTQIKARSPALQTFVIQLCGSGSYLPTARAVAGEGYGAIPQSSIVGPEGGQVLVDETIKQLDQLWQPKRP